MNSDLGIISRVGQLHRDEVRIAVVRRFKKFRQQERDPAILRRKEQPTHVRGLGISTDEAVDADHVIIRIVGPLDGAIENAVICAAELVIDSVCCHVSAP